MTPASRHYGAGSALPRHHSRHKKARSPGAGRTGPPRPPLSGVHRKSQGFSPPRRRPHCVRPLCSGSGTGPRPPCASLRRHWRKPASVPPRMPLPLWYHGILQNSVSRPPWHPSPPSKAPARSARYRPGADPLSRPSYRCCQNRRARHKHQCASPLSLLKCRRMAGTIFSMSLSQLMPRARNSSLTSSASRPPLRFSLSSPPKMQNG